MVEELQGTRGSAPRLSGALRRSLERILQAAMILSTPRTHKQQYNDRRAHNTDFDLQGPQGFTSSIWMSCALRFRWPMRMFLALSRFWSSPTVSLLRSASVTGGESSSCETQIRPSSQHQGFLPSFWSNPDAAPGASNQSRSEGS